MPSLLACADEVIEKRREFITLVSGAAVAWSPAAQTL
jgi:hypothetical protein